MHLVRPTYNLSQTNRFSRKKIKRTYVPLLFIYSMDFLCIIIIFGQIFYSSIKSDDKEFDPSQPINHSTASIKNRQGGEEGFEVFMIVMLSIFCIFILIFMGWLWLISFRLAKHFGKFRRKSNFYSDDVKFIDMYQNDIRVIQGTTNGGRRVRRLRFGMTPDGSFERMPGAPRGI